MCGYINVSNTSQNLFRDFFLLSKFWFLSMLNVFVANVNLTSIPDSQKPEKDISYFGYYFT